MERGGVVHDHRLLEHSAARLACVAGLAAQEAEDPSQLDVVSPSRPRALFVELARAELFQPGNRLRASADRALVFGPASSSHTSRVVAGLSTVPVPIAVCACGDDLAVVANRATGR